MQSDSTGGYFQSIFEDIPVSSPELGIHEFWEEKSGGLDLPSEEDVKLEGKLYKQRDILSFLWISRYIVLTLDDLWCFEVQTRIFHPNWALRTKQKRHSWVFAEEYNRFA